MGDALRNWPIALIVTVSLAPLLATELPPLHDYPFHLARLDALAALTGLAVHPTAYQLGNLILPNVALDAVGLALTTLMPPVLAGRVFVGVTLALILTGTVALHRALHGHRAAWPLVAGLFLYNEIFMLGFLNYLFGLGVMLWMVAVWWSARQRGVAWQMVVGVCAAVTLMFCHLFSFGIFVTVTGGMSMTCAWARRREGIRAVITPLLAAGLPALAGLVAFAVLSPTAGAASEPWTYVPWSLFKPFIFVRSLLSLLPWLDLVTLLPLFVAVTVALATRRLVIVPVMWLPIALLLAIFAVLPSSMFSAQIVDARLPVAILLVAIAATDLRHLTARATAILTAAITVLLVLRSAAIAQDWRAADEVLAEYRAAFATLPAGSVVWAATTEPYPTILYDSAADLARWHPPLKHVASLASIGSDIFVPSTWANPRQQPIAVRPEFVAAKRLQQDNPFRTPTAADLEAVVRAIRALPPDGPPHPGYILVTRPAAMRGAIPPDLHVVARGQTFVLLTVD